MKINTCAPLAIAAIALAFSAAPSAIAQNTMMQHHLKKHRHMILNASNSGVVIGGSYGSQSGYNNNQHHNYVPQRKYYTYEGHDYYIDLNTGLRFRF